MARKQLIFEITRALQQLGGQASTSAIMDVVDQNYKWGATRNSVANLLSRHKQFRHVEHVDYHVPADSFGPGYRVRETIWRLDLND
jgi:hypothetical protein